MDRIEIKKWLLEQGLTQSDVARRVGVSHTMVSLVVAGKRKSARVVNALLDMGCPREFIEGVDEAE